MRQILLYFRVSNRNGEKQLVVASQDIQTDRKKAIIAARKVFTLDTPDGEEVFPLKNQRSFMKRDGAVLRVVGQGIMSTSEQRHNLHGIPKIAI